MGRAGSGTLGQSARLGPCTSTPPRLARCWTTGSWPGCRPTRFADVVQLGETTSTNSVLLERAQAGAPEGLVVVADYQTRAGAASTDGGSRRRGRRCCSRCSCALQPGEELPAAAATWPWPPCRWPWPTRRRPWPGSSVQLKWPNDLVVTGDRKVAGVLAESAGGRGPGRRGRGQRGLGAGVGRAATQPRARLAGRPVDRGELLVETLLALDRLYGRWDMVAGATGQTCATVGRQVTVQLAGGLPDLLGTAVAVDEDGRLVVRDRRRHHGDSGRRRRYPPAARQSA